jgi:hypothetical protein
MLADFFLFMFVVGVCSFFGGLYLQMVYDGAKGSVPLVIGVVCVCIGIIGIMWTSKPSTTSPCVQLVQQDSSVLDTYTMTTLPDGSCTFRRKEQ